MVKVPVPEALDVKSTFLPFSVTETFDGLAARMVIESVTVNSCSQGPVTLSATALVPSQVISSQEYSPSATLTLTTVACWVVVAAESVAVASSPVASVVVEPELSEVLVLIVDLVDELELLLELELESSPLDDPESALFTLTVCPAWLLAAPVLALTHEVAAKTKMPVKTMARITMIAKVAFLESEKNPRIPPLCEPRLLPRCPPRLPEP